MRRLHWNISRTILLVAVSVILLACAAPKGLLDNTTQPVEPANADLQAGLFPLELIWETTTATGYNTAPEAGTDHTIYVGTPQEVIALDVESGQVKWVTPIKYSGQKRLLAAAGSNVYTTSNARTELVSLRADDGQVRWRVRLSNILVSHPGNVFVESVVATTEQLVILAVENRSMRVLSLDATSGDVTWLTTREKPWYLAGGGWLHLLPDSILVIHGSGWIQIDMSTGAVIRQLRGSLAGAPATPYYTVNTLYTGGQPIQALNMTTLRERWRFSDSCYEWNILQRVVSVGDGIAYAFSTCNRLVALAETDGRILWSFVPPRGERVLSFTLFEGHGYLLTTGFMLYQLAPRTGAILGQLALPSNTLQLFSSGGVYTAPQLLLVQLNQVQLLAFRKLESAIARP